METLFLTTEMAPFVPGGAPADMAAALPKTLRTLGHGVTVMMPAWVDRGQASPPLARRLTPLRVSIAGKTWTIMVHEGRLSSQVDLVLLEIPGLPSYAESQAKQGDPATLLALALFSRAAVLWAAEHAASGRPVEVLHSSGWGAALAMAYVAEERLHTPTAHSPHTVFTFHHTEEEGVVSETLAHELGAPFVSQEGQLSPALSFLRQGLACADTVTTVSETYAEELCTPAAAHGLVSFLPYRSNPWVGVTYGIDTSVWNPAIDPSLPARYDAEDRSGKVLCHSALQQSFELPVRPSVPLVAALVRHPGEASLLAEALPPLMLGTSAQVVILGRGEAARALFEPLMQRMPGRVGWSPDADSAKIHNVLAGADVAAMSLCHAPCDPMPMCAQRYGTPPVALAAGGTCDMVVDADLALQTGSGFLFAEPTGEALLGALERALAASMLPLYPLWVQRMMRRDNSWERAARRYAHLYRARVPAASDTP